MHAEKLVPPVNCDNILPVKTSSASYKSDLNSTSPTVNELYANSKPNYLTMNDSSTGCYQPSIYSYGQTPFNNTGNSNINNYDQAAINRRKNATRETTNTLKAWLYEHRKNPYPTKGEKIMLAIITKMTLTQVSTWFANARRRLKKENKMTWEPRNKCNSGSGDESSDSEMMMNENQESTNINDESLNVTKKLKKNNIKNENDDDLISGISSDDQQSVYRRSKIKSVDDSDSNTSSNLVPRNSPLFNNKANFSNFGKTDLNYSSNENSFSNLGNSENRERFFNYSNVGRNHEQNQVQYNTNRISHHPQYHITYSSISSVTPTTNLTYVQSQQHLNENSLYNLNTIHPHQYQNGKHQTECFQPTNPSSSNLPSHQNQVSQDLNIIHNSQHHPVYHHHHVPTNMNPHNASYSLLQSSYQADCMLAQQNHHLHQPTSSVNVQQLNPNSIYYPPIPQAQNTLTQQLSPQQVQSNSRLNNCESSSFISPLAPTKLHLNSSNEIIKCDENNNSDNNLVNNTSQENSLTNSSLENTRKIWSLAQTATDSLSANNSIPNPAIGINQENISPLVSSNSNSGVDNLSISTYINSTIDHLNQQPNDQIMKNSSSINISSTPSLQLSPYMNNQLINNNSSVIDNSSMINSNNQPVQNYNNALNQNYSSLDCGHNSNTFLGKVFFDYISTGTTGPLENDRNWTRIGLL